MALTTAQQALKLFKKLIGVSDTTSARDYYNESITSNQHIQTNQIWTDSNLIPNTAPSGMTNGQIIGVVAYYSDVQLIEIPNTNAYYSELLKDAIPFNYGDFTSYSYKLKDNVGNTIDSGQGEWVVDTDSGVLTFYSTKPSNMPPKISFYKYVGRKGIINYPTGSTSGNIVLFNSSDGSSLKDSSISLTGLTTDVNNKLSLTGGSINGNLTLNGYIYGDGSKLTGITANQVGAYTTGQTDTKLATKSDTGHTHNYLPLSGGSINGKLIISGDTNIIGNIYQQGVIYETHAQKIYTSGNTITLRDGATNTLNENEYVGFTAKKYDGTNDGQLVFDKNGVARVGDIGQTQPLATREEVPLNGGLASWDGSSQKFITLDKNSLSYLPSSGGTINGNLYVRLNNDTGTIYTTGKTGFIKTQTVDGYGGTRVDIIADTVRFGLPNNNGAFSSRIDPNLNVPAIEFGNMGGGFVIRGGTENVSWLNGDLGNALIMLPDGEYNGVVYTGGMSIRSDVDFSSHFEVITGQIKAKIYESEILVVSNTGIDIQGDVNVYGGSIYGNGSNISNITANQVGAYTTGQTDTKLATKSDTGHTHNYLPSSGGTINGTITANNLSGTNTGDERYTNSTPTPLSIGGVLSGSTFSGKTMTQMFDAILYPELFPTLTAPSNTFTTTFNTYYEVGYRFSSIVFNAGFNRGSISPAYGTSGYRSGLPTIYEYTGSGLINTTTTSLTDSKTISNYDVVLGTNTWTSRVGYSAGEQPLSSKGNNYNTPLAGGYTGSVTKSFTGVYPFLCGMSPTLMNGSTLYPAFVGSKILDVATNKTVTLNGSQQYIYFMYPATYNDLISIIDNNGYDVTSSFNKTTVSITSSGLGTNWTTNYKVYRTNDITDVPNKQYKFNFV